MWEARKQAGLTVALRKESVDRNIPAFRLCDVLSTVALRKESVDRNTNSSIVNVAAGVALRKESVDRNIFAVILVCVHPAVALRKESVDRNHTRRGRDRGAYCRSPQGERG